MGIFVENIIFEAVLFILFLCWVFYSYSTKHYNYWKHLGVPYVKPRFPFGCKSDLVLGKRHVGEIYETLYWQFKNVPYFGVYETRNPVLVVKDPELIKHILIKDFQHFVDRSNTPVNKRSEYILWHLFSMTGQEWKNMRLKLAPTFTSGKMKLMFFLMLKCSEQLREHINNQIKTNPDVNIKDVFARFTMDVIATCAFGLEINSQTEKDCEFYQIGMQIFNDNLLSTRRALYELMPFLNKLVSPRVVPTHVTKFLTKTVRETVKYRVDNNVNRNDFLDMLIKNRQDSKLLNDEKSTNNKVKDKQQNTPNESQLTIEEITAQCFIFFFAGFETASSTMSFCLYELSRNPEVQEALYQEVKQVLAKHGGTPTYQALQEMTYMDQVINETLRRYASLPSLDRICTEAYKMPDSDLVIQKGQRVTIPTYAIHHDPDYYPDPYKFDPERFSPDQIKGRIPFLHLPFGEGPRMCIGMRFGMMQMKIGLTEMISKFHFSLSPNTIPVETNKRSFVTKPSKPVLLNVRQRTAED